MTRLRAISSIAIASAALAFTAAGCGDDDPEPVATAPGTASVPTGTQPATTPGQTQPGQPDPAPGTTQPPGQSEEFGRYTLAINEVLRESASFAVAVQACARDKKGEACVDKADDKLDDVGEKYDAAAAALAKGAPKACRDALAKSGDAVDDLVDVLERIGDVAESGSPEQFNREAQDIGKALQGRAGDLVAAQSACQQR